MILLPTRSADLLLLRVSGSVRTLAMCLTAAKAQRSPAGTLQQPLGYSAGTLNHVNFHCHANAHQCHCRGCIFQLVLQQLSAPETSWLASTYKEQHQIMLGDHRVNERLAAHQRRCAGLLNSVRETYAGAFWQALQK